MILTYSFSIPTASKWQSRQDAIKSIAAFVNEKDLPPSPEALQSDSSHILVLVKEHTRGFKETNINVSKSIMELFLALCDCHEKMSCPLPTWAGREIAIMACSKISDKKLSPLSKSLLMSACVVQSPHVIMCQSFASMSQVKAPIAQEEFLLWMLAFSKEFGAAAIGPGLKETVLFVSEVRIKFDDKRTGMCDEPLTILLFNSIVILRTSRSRKPHWLSWAPSTFK